jgi:hypothetical protein
MHYGHKHKSHHLKFGSKSGNSHKLGEKYQYKTESYIPLAELPSIPDTNVVSHEDGIFFLQHRKKDNNHAIRNINRGSIGDKYSLEKHKREHKLDQSMYFR